jgi:hypothetical protein
MLCLQLCTLSYASAGWENCRIFEDLAPDKLAEKKAAPEDVANEAEAARLAVEVEKDVSQELAGFSLGLGRNLTPEQIEKAVESSLMRRLRAGRGTIAILGAMMATSYVTTMLTANLPQNMAFVAHFVSQLSTFIVVAFGSISAPLVEPLVSGTRKAGFLLQGRGNSRLDESVHRDLERLWMATQGNLSLNAQMARNNLLSYIGSVQFNFLRAIEELQLGNRRLALSLIAEAAVRQRKFFSEYDPDNRFIVDMVRLRFTEQWPKALALRPEILQWIQEMDSDATVNPEIIKYYDTLLDSWLSEMPKPPGSA